MGCMEPWRATLAAACSEEASAEQRQAAISSLGSSPASLLDVVAVSSPCWR